MQIWLLAKLANKSDQAPNTYVGQTMLASFARPLGFGGFCGFADQIGRLVIFRGESLDLTFLPSDGPILWISKNTMIDSTHFMLHTLKVRHNLVIDVAVTVGGYLFMRMRTNVYVYNNVTTVRINFCNFLVFLMSVKVLHSKLGKLM